MRAPFQRCSPRDERSPRTAYALIHDELLLEAPMKEIPRLTKLLKEVMEGMYELRVPLLVDTKVGPNWRDMK